MSLKTAFIVSTPHLEDLATQSKYHLTLAHKVLEDDKYAAFYKKRHTMGDFVIVDNSAYELGHPIETPKLIEAAKRVDADEIVCPDYLYDGEKTILSANKFLTEYNEEFPKLVGTKRSNLAAVPQGRDVLDYIKCYSYFLNNPEISTIGLSFLGLEKVLPDVSPTYRRLVMLDKLYSAHMLSKPIHLLGIADNIVELKLIASTPMSQAIRGNDSSSAYIHGAGGIYFSPIYGMAVPKFKNKMDFGSKLKDITPVLHNINVIKKWTGQK